MNNHVLHQIPDYVLDLLPGVERQQVEKHAHQCAQCRQAIQRETQLSQVVWSTLHIATQPTPGQLRQFMPPIPQPHAPRWLLWRTHKQLAPLLLLLLLLLLGSFGWQTWRQNLIPHTSYLIPSAMTATVTQSPTATATNRPQDLLPTSTAMAFSPNLVITPAPNPTPLVAVLYLSN